MTRIHRMILKMFPAPFVGWLGAFMFLLVMQFLIRHMSQLVGRGLPISAILELVSYSLAYMVVLAVPMSVLIATLMTYGRLAETGAYAVIKSSGVSLPQLIWPSILVGATLTAGMWHFNSVILPEANYRAKTLWTDIRQKKPGFELEPGVFYDGIEDYSILVKQIDHETGDLDDVTIFDRSQGSKRRADIKAATGRLSTADDGAELLLELYDGELHRLLRDRTSADHPERYERLKFETYVFRLDLSDLAFRRSDPGDERRSDRTMRTSEMQEIVDSLRATVEETRRELMNRTFLLGAVDSTGAAANVRPVSLRPPGENGRGSDPRDRLRDFSGMDPDRVRALYNRSIQGARLVRSNIDNAKRTLLWQEQRANRFAVEIHKKYSIAVACVIFVLIGAPLGLSIRRGSLARSAVVSVGILLFYWVTLVQGEKLADRGLIEPWVGMWAANVVTGIGGLWVFLYTFLDLKSTPSIMSRLRRRP
ncbi:MAG: LptF/LptG family permease [Rhodothermales bacterium]|nr:LptF/LptG family permease [Rhodothermales bacterium]